VRRREARWSDHCARNVGERIVWPMSRSSRTFALMLRRLVRARLAKQRLGAHDGQAKVHALATAPCAAWPRGPDPRRMGNQEAGHEACGNVWSRRIAGLERVPC
jgi:hypothetical protein